MDKSFVTDSVHVMLNILYNLYKVKYKIYKIYKIT